MLGRLFWMSVALLGLAVCLSAASCHHAPAPTPETPRPIARMPRATLFSICEDGSGGTGSGVFIGPRSVLTAWHVVGTCPGETKFVRSGDHLYTAELERGDPTHDTAVLRLSDSVSDWARHFGDLTLGGWVCADFSYPVDQQKCGAVVKIGGFSMRGGPDLEQGARIRYRSVPGNSGGGVFDTEGRLVGINLGSFFDNGDAAVGRIPLWVRDHH